MKRTPLGRKSPLKGGGRVKPRNAKRRKSEWARAYGSVERVEWVNALDGSGMPTRIELTLPVPPSVNRIWRTGNGRTYKDAKARAYGLAVEAEWRTSKLPRPAFPAGVAVRYTLTWYRFPASGDLSNRLKLVEDALNGLAWADDRQIVSITAMRYDCRRGEQGVHLIIEEAE